MALPLPSPRSAAAAAVLTVACALLAAGERADRSVAPGAPVPPPRLALPLDFVPNVGQWPSRIEFVARTGALAAALTRSAIELPSLRLAFEGASPSAALVGESRGSGRYNFVLGADPAQWRSDVPAYRSVLYRGLYDGVDVRVREAGPKLEYDVLVAPDTDLGGVVVRAEGARSLALARDGALLVTTPRGTLRQARPLAWEELGDGSRRPLRSRFRVLEGGRFGFAVDGRDESLPLVVDPGLDWATFLGGSGDESITGLELAPDGSGDLVVAGQTASPDFPRTRGNLVRVGWTPYVARLSADGSRLVYATFFGGSGNHSVQDVGLDGAGRPAVVGDTTSEDFPTTPGAFDRTPGNGFSGDYDAYVIKFEADGGGPVFGTYLGGNPGTGTDQAWNVAFDSSGSPIVSGFTSSASFPTTAGAYDRTAGGQDAFVSRLSPDGSRLTYSTFFGGDGIEEVFDMAVDPAGFVTLAGKITQFPDQPAPMPTTPDAFDRTFDGGGSYPGIDGYVARLRLDGAGAADLRYATFLGGAQYKDGVTGVAFDPADPGSVTVVGWTYSGDFPTTPGALLRTHFIPVDTSMAFATRFRFPAAGAGSLVWSTLYGAPGNQSANDVAIDARGAPILVGATGAADPPTTERAYDRIPGTGAFRGVADAFVARLDPTGSRLEYATLLGGSYNDETAQNVVYLGGSSVVTAGITNSPDFPVTPGAFDTVYGADGRPSGGSAPGTTADDAFVAKLTLEPSTGDTTPPPAPTLKGPASGSSYVAHVPGITFDWTDVPDASGIAAYHLQVSVDPGFRNTGGLRWYEPWLPTSVEVKDFSISETGTFYWRVQALDGAGNLGPWSEVRELTVDSPTPPAAPVLASPPDNGRFAPGDIVLDWNPAARAKFYEVQVDTRSDFANPNRLWVRGLTATRYTASLTTEGKRWWRVRATNDSLDYGPWSSVRAFELRRGSPAAPVPPPDQDGGAAPPPGGTATAVAGFAETELGVNGGASGTLTVRLNGAAPSGGAAVALASQYPALVTVPPSVTVPAGATSATFAVTAPHALPAGSSVVWAEYGGAAAQGIRVTNWAVQTAPDLDKLSIAGTTVWSGINGTVRVVGGQSLTGTVGFAPGWKAPPGGAIVALGSTDPTLASVPDRAVVPAGAEHTSFTVTTQPVAEVTYVTILASRSMTERITLELLPSGALQSLSLNPTTVTGGEPSTGTVTLSGPAPAGGVSVALSSHDTRWATVPASVTVPAGATAAGFTVTTLQNTSGEGQWSIISASAGGITRTQTINVNPRLAPPPGEVALSSFVLDPSTVAGGTTSTGRVTLTGAAPSGGVLVSIVSRDAAATVPPSLTIPAGSSSGSFTIQTSPVSGFERLAWIAIGTSNSSREAALTITPAPAQPEVTLSALSVNPTTVTGGTSSSGTVTLSAAAPTGGAVVALASSNAAAATVPASVTVAAGATSASFAIATLTGSSTRTTDVSATFGGVTRTATLTVTASTASADTVSITRLEYDGGGRRLRVEATSTSSSTTLRAHVGSTDQLIGTLANNGGGRYSADFSWPSNPGSVTVRSSLGGSATRTVTVK